MTLKSNSDDNNDLDILFCKNGDEGLFAGVVESFFGATFSKEIYIYMQDGTVIKCINRIANDFVDGKAKAVYLLNEDQLRSLRNSNIHSVRYTLEFASDDNGILNMELNKSASNTGLPTKAIISDFLDGKITDTIDFKGTDTGQKNKGVTTGSLSSRVYGEGSGSVYQGTSYDLTGRQALFLSIPQYASGGEGTVVVEVTIDRDGRVTAATSGVKGSTTLDETLLRVAKEAALTSRFDRKPDAPILQKGTITYIFTLK